MAMHPEDKLTGTKWIGFCLQIVPLLRNLRDANTTMPYDELAARIGLLGPDGWRPWRRSQIKKILYACAAIENYADVQEFEDFADYARTISGSGEPGSGLWGMARMGIIDPTENVSTPDTGGRYR